MNFLLWPFGPLPFDFLRPSSYTEISLMAMSVFLSCSESAVWLYWFWTSRWLHVWYLFIGFVVQMVSTSKKVLNHHHVYRPFSSERVESGHICLPNNSTVTGHSLLITYKYACGACGGGGEGRRVMNIINTESVYGLCNCLHSHHCPPPTHTHTHTHSFSPSPYTMYTPLSSLSHTQYPHTPHYSSSPKPFHTHPHTWVM